MKDIWRDPLALATALINFHKITGVSLHVVLGLSGFEDEHNASKLKQYPQ